MRRRGPRDDAVRGPNSASRVNHRGAAQRDAGVDPIRHGRHPPRVLDPVAVHPLVPRPAGVPKHDGRFSREAGAREHHRLEMSRPLVARQRQQIVDVVVDLRGHRYLATASRTSVAVAWDGYAGDAKLSH